MPSLLHRLRPSHLARRLARPGAQAGHNPQAGYSPQAGYNLVMLIVAITVLNILLAVALPYWSKAIQREKEEELIARGLQYAEAIRVFRARFGRLPVRLEELIEVEPRSIRRLWDDPMTDSGKWGLVFETAGNRPGGNRNGTQVVAEGQQADSGLPQSGGDGDENGRQTVGPIAGVHSLHDEESIQIWSEKQNYTEWLFTYHLLVGGGAPQVAQGGGPGEASGGQGFGTGGVGGQGPSPTYTFKADYIGRPFRPGIQPPALPGVGAPPNAGGEEADSNGRPAGAKPPPGLELGGGLGAQPGQGQPPPAGSPP